MKERDVKIAAWAALFVCALVSVVLLATGGARRAFHAVGPDTLMPAPPTTGAAETISWKQAAKKVEEDRGEPIGRQAKIEIPSQLRHYSDTRRFLAVQVAEWREHRFETPQDYAGLAELISQGELVEVKPISATYILYGVGGSADTELFSHYDEAAKKRVPLYNQQGLEREMERIAESVRSLEEEISGLKKELNATARNEREARRRLDSSIKEKDKALKAERDAKETLDTYYGKDEERQRLFARFAAIENLARDFGGRTYQLDDARSRKEMKVRMLSFLRPEALRMLEEVAASYQQRFERPLPITSLIRPDEYQQQLSKRNPNATLIDTPPHSTGLAFDVFYRFMTAEEQSYVMAELARLKDEGRIEVLRENRDHYHVFAFIDGARPNETLISQSLGRRASPAAPPEKTSEAAHASKKREAKADTRADKKDVRKRAAVKKEEKRGGRRRR